MGADLRQELPVAAIDVGGIEGLVSFIRPGLVQLGSPLVSNGEGRSFNVTGVPDTVPARVFEQHDGTPLAYEPHIALGGAARAMELPLPKGSSSSETPRPQTSDSPTDADSTGAAERTLRQIARESGVDVALLRRQFVRSQRVRDLLNRIISPQPPKS